jgi:hypothetical protein
MARRRRLFLTAASIALPFLLPVAALGVWLVGETFGQAAETGNIIASIDASGSGTTYLSTLMPDGNSATWTCSAGTFFETSEPEATGRSVTWKPDPGFADSVTIVVSTPTAVDSVRFLPFIPLLTPSITVSAAYHLATLDRARGISLSAGDYSAIIADDNLSGYDGIVVLVAREPGRGRTAHAVAPGDTLPLDLPLGAEIEAFCIDHTEDALDNGGSVLITFSRDST